MDEPISPGNDAEPGSIVGLQAARSDLGRTSELVDDAEVRGGVGVGLVVPVEVRTDGSDRSRGSPGVVAVPGCVERNDPVADGQGAADQPGLAPTGCPPGTSGQDDDDWCNCADGGTHIHIPHNRVRESDFGIEVAAENARGAVVNVQVSRNRISGSLYPGLTAGG